MEQKFYSIKEYRLYHHILYWIGNICLYVLFIFLTFGDFKEPLINKLCYLPSQLIITYTLFYLVFPFLDTRKFFLSGISLLLSTYLATTIARFLKIYVYEPAMEHEAEKESIIEILSQQGPLMGQYMLWCFLTPIITTMIVLLINHYRRQAKLGLLKKEKSISELNFLKSQVHPHFLFNTLNNLYTLSITKSPHTAEIAGKLHDILEYMFYKCNGKEVDLQEEVQLIKNYIDLERIRYNSRLEVDFTSNISSKNTAMIAPLILITLVENAFKHGVSDSIHDSYIRIKLSLNKKFLEFYVLNSKSTHKKVDQSAYREGIGLKNMKKQLDLIYGNGHKFTSLDSDEEFAANLKIDLAYGR